MCGFLNGGTLTFEVFMIHIYLLIHGFIIAGTVEECLKGYITQYCMKIYIKHLIYLNENDVDTIIWFGLCSGLGFGTFEGVVYACVYYGSGNLISQGYVFLIRILLAIPFHTMTGILWGCEMARMYGLKENYHEYNTINPFMMNHSGPLIAQRLAKGSNASSISHTPNVGLNMSQVSDLYDNSLPTHNLLSINNANSNSRVSNDNGSGDLNSANVLNQHWIQLFFNRWYVLGCKQIFYHGLFDFIQFEFGAQGCDDNISYGETMEIISLIIGLVFAIIFIFIVRRYVREITDKANKSITFENDNNDDPKGTNSPYVQLADEP